MEMYIPSGYEDFGSYRERENLHLVRSRQNQNLYLLKKLDVFDESVLDELIDHPVCGTARIHGRYRVNDSLYTIEEYVSGRTLREVLSQGPVDEEQACTWILELLNVLEPLHHRKPAIVHRDIKPENIMINAQNELILVDFNAAKTVDEEKSKDTVLIGTNGYASPEQYGFQVSSPASDIYAVGVLFREMLTGSLEDTNAYQGKYRKVIDRCLSLDPEKRYRDAGEMTAALTALRERKKTLWRFLPPGFQTKNLVGLWAALAFYYTWFGGGSQYGGGGRQHDGPDPGALLLVCRLYPGYSLDGQLPQHLEEGSADEKQKPLRPLRGGGSVGALHPDERVSAQRADDDRVNIRCFPVQISYILI